MVKYMLVILCVIALACVYAYAAPAGGKKPAANTDEGSPSTDEPATKGGKGQQPAALQMGGNFGKGTDAVFFNDKSLVSTPVPTMTPDVKIEKQEINAWNNIRNTKDLIKRCTTDLPRYEKYMRKEFMSNLNEMQKAITTLHTYALLYKRDEVEYVWGNAAKKGEQTLATCEEFANEFNENYDQMVKNQKAVMKLLSKASAKIQQPVQVRQEWESNREQMFWAKKKIDYFNGLFMDYVSKYNKTIDEKDKLVQKLLDEHKELHKP
jgi:hypothetical protein